MIRMSVTLTLAALVLASGTDLRGEQPAERATTSALPAALAHIKVAPSETLTLDQARQVRGQFTPTIGTQFYVLGVGKYGADSTIAYQFAGGGRSATLAFTPNGLVFVTQGTAVVGTAPPIQGLIAGGTVPFTGLIGIQTASSSLQVVARPDLFLVQVP